MLLCIFVSFLTACLSRSVLQCYRYGCKIKYKINNNIINKHNIIFFLFFLFFIPSLQDYYTTNLKINLYHF